MTAPTVAQVRAYLKHLGWHPCKPFADGATVWWQYPNATGWHVVIPDWADDDTRLLERSSAIGILADATGRTLEEAAADIIAADQDFWGCSRDCWPRSTPPAEWIHTLEYGRCGQASEPLPGPATLDIPATWIAEDGYPSASWASVPLTLFAPWAEHLPPEGQRAMLAEVAVVEPWHREDVVAQWRHTAEQLANANGGGVDE